jgi:hypothetical protein
MPVAGCALTFPGGEKRRMYDRLLAISLVVVGLGGLYVGLRATFTAVLASARGTALVWRLMRSRELCPDCRRLGERCPWCCDDTYRITVGALAVALPVVALPLMLRSWIEFSPQAKWIAGAWAAVWLAAGLTLL